MLNKNTKNASMIVAKKGRGNDGGRTQRRAGKKTMRCWGEEEEEGKHVMSTTDI